MNLLLYRAHCYIGFDLDILNDESKKLLGLAVIKDAWCIIDSPCRMVRYES